jgi:hypothetical protein
MLFPWLSEWLQRPGAEVADKNPVPKAVQRTVKALKPELVAVELDEALTFLINVGDKNGIYGIYT